MRPRKEAIEMFSTFVQFEADRFARWVTDIKLRRNMQQCLEHTPEACDSEYFWSLYWHKGWQTQASLARSHLLAYLQEPCYWAAQQTLRKFMNTQYQVSDYFQMALAETDAVLKSFNSSRGAGLKTYASMAFLSLLKNSLRQRHEVDICTHWSLLNKISKKRLIEALQNAGMSTEMIAQYRLAWTCFKTLYIRSSPTESLPKVDTSLWEAIAKLYNAERLHQLISPGSTCSAETIEQWLTNCAVSVRNYLYPPIDSLNVPKAGQDTGEIQDYLPTLMSESLLTEIEIQEESHQRETQYAQIYTALETALKQMDQSSQQLMRLYYKEGLTQQQIIQQLQMSQSTISRRLTKAREALLNTLIQWSQRERNSSVTPTLIKDISTVLEEWLVAYYSELDPSFRNSRI